MIDFNFLDTEFISLEKNCDWLKKVIKTEKKILGELTFIFCNDAYLHKKNMQFLRHDTLTDIITFDYSDKNIIIGDIFISVERVKENSDIFEVTFLSELDRVMIHGLLHLLGYKDRSKEEKKIMRFKENFYLSKK